MAPDTRRLVQLSVGAPKKVNELLDMLLSKKRAPDRKTWLEKKVILQRYIRAIINYGRYSNGW